MILQEDLTIGGIVDQPGQRQVWLMINKRTILKGTITKLLVSCVAKRETLESSLPRYISI